MSRKKLRLDPDRRIEVLSRDPAHSVSLPLEMFRLCSILVSFSRVLAAKLECARRGKQDDVNHGSIRGSWPIAISGYPRGHSV